MVQINCTVYEKYALLSYLKYAATKKREELDKGKMTEKLYKMELAKIETLKKRINGIYHEDYLDEQSWKSKKESKEQEETKICIE